MGATHHVLPIVSSWLVLSPARPSLRPMISPETHLTSPPGVAGGWPPAQAPACANPTPRATKPVVKTAAFPQSPPTPAPTPRTRPVAARPLTAPDPPYPASNATPTISAPAPRPISSISAYRFRSAGSSLTPSHRTASTVRPLLSLPRSLV